MVDISEQKEIVKVAVGYFLEMMKATETPIYDPRLEEIEKVQGDNKWNITVSYLENIQGETFAALYGNKERIYKIITVNGDEKIALSMKNR